MGERSAKGSRGDVPFDASVFAVEGYAAVVSAQADLDLDGADEHIVGYQCTVTDDLGEPAGPAYFTIARLEEGVWQEWIGVPAPSEETYVDSGSVIATGDINDDGTAELVLRFYSFGVSGRPANIYFWRVMNSDLQPAIVGGVAEMSSHDGFAMHDVDPNCPGPEFLFAWVDIGDEPQAEPHRYSIEVWGWGGKTYDQVGGALPGAVYESPDAAIAAYLSGGPR